MTLPILNLRLSIKVEKNKKPVNMMKKQEIAERLARIKAVESDVDRNKEFYHYREFTR
jgi:hypothetical protein